MKKIIFVISLLILTINLYAGNPGQSAMNCIDASTNGSKLTFRNTCDYKIFVVWCGDLKYSKKMCRDGKKNTFYTSSRNLAPFASYSTTLKDNGSYKYAGCKGGIGFGSKGIVHNNSNNGRFNCTKTGKQSNANESSQSNQNNDATLQGKWKVQIQQPNGRWTSEYVVFKYNGKATYTATNNESYPAKWKRYNNTVTLTVFGTQTHYNRDDPAYTCRLEIEGSKFTGTTRIHSMNVTLKTKGYKKY